MIMSYYSPQVDMVLLASEENMGAMSPFSSCQSPPSNIYSSPPHHQMTHPIPTTLPSTGPIYTQPPYRPVMNSPYPPHSSWSSQSMQMPPISSYSYPQFTTISAGSVMAPDLQLLPQSFAEPRQSRSDSASSSGIGLPSSAPPSERTPPRSLSPTSPDLRAYGFPNKNGTWSCAYPGCTSRAVFTRGCDLRKHHKRHSKNFFCRHAECPQATGGGFSSKKDLARHEAKHNPGVLCDWTGCDRVFSRVDNMRDHVKRIHNKASRKSSAAS